MATLGPVWQWVDGWPRYGACTGYCVGWAVAGPGADRHLDGQGARARAAQQLDVDLERAAEHARVTHELVVTRVRRVGACGGVVVRRRRPRHRAGHRDACAGVVLRAVVDQR